MNCIKNRGSTSISKSSTSINDLPISIANRFLYDNWIKETYDDKRCQLEGDLKLHSYITLSLMDSFLEDILGIKSAI